MEEEKKIIGIAATALFIAAIVIVAFLIPIAAHKAHAANDIYGGLQQDAVAGAYAGMESHFTPNSATPVTTTSILFVGVTWVADGFSGANHSHMHPSFDDSPCSDWIPVTYFGQASAVAVGCPISGTLSATTSYKVGFRTSNVGEVSSWGGTFNQTIFGAHDVSLFRASPGTNPSAPINAPIGSSVATFGFILNYDPGNALYGEPAIAMSYPNSSLAQSDFKNWVVSLSGANGGLYTATIRYQATIAGLNDNSLVLTDAKQIQGTTNSATLFTIPKHIHLVTGNYYAYAEIKDNITKFTATSSIVQFQIDNNVAFSTSTTAAALAGEASSSYDIPILLPGELPEIPEYDALFSDPNSTSSLFYVDCTSFGGSIISSSTLPAIGCYIDKGWMFLLGNLIAPHHLVKNIFYKSTIAMQGVFPFNVILGTARTAQADLNSTSTDKTLYLPIFGSQFKLLSTSTLPDVVGTGTASVIMTAERSVIWLGSLLVAISLIL